MKPKRSMSMVTLATVGMMALGGVSTAAAQMASETAASGVAVVMPATQTAPPSTIAHRYVQAIEQAPDPSSAIEAYARGYAAVPHDMAIQQAYLQRMVDFGLPEMADVQARDLLLRQPNNALALTVEAANAARRGSVSDALRDLVKAATLDPQNPFVLKTAGQLIAYYDTIADQSGLAPKLRLAIDQVHRALDGKAAFDKAYIAARQTYLQGKAELQQPPAVPAQPQSAKPNDQTPFSGYSSTGPQSDTYNYYNYYNDYPGYRGYPTFPGYYGAWWWPGETRIIIGFGIHDHRAHHSGHHGWYQHHGHGLPGWLFYNRFHHRIGPGPRYYPTLPPRVIPPHSWQSKRNWYQTRSYPPGLQGRSGDWRRNGSHGDGGPGHRDQTHVAPWNPGGAGQQGAGPSRFHHRIWPGKSGGGFPHVAPNRIPGPTGGDHRGGEMQRSPGSGGSSTSGNTSPQADGHAPSH